MNDKEKALQLAGLKETPDEEERYYNPFNCKIYDKCLEMAQWKQEQLIEKAVEWLKENVTYEHPTRGKKCVVNLTAFKQAMMEE